MKRLNVCKLFCCFKINRETIPNVPSQPSVHSSVSYCEVATDEVPVIFPAVVREPDYNFKQQIRNWLSSAEPASPAESYVYEQKRPKNV